MDTNSARRNHSIESSAFACEMEKGFDQMLWVDDVLTQRVRILWMPLHAHHPARLIVRMNEGFDQSVLGTMGLNDEAIAKVFYSLMVNRIDTVRSIVGIQLLHERPIYPLYLVIDSVIDHCITVLEAVRPLSGDVLIECATEIGVHQLKTTADAEHGFLLVQEHLDQLHLISIAVAVTLPSTIENRCFVIALWGKIDSALQHESIQLLHQTLDFSLRQIRNQNGNHSLAGDVSRHIILQIAQRFRPESEALEIGIEKAGGDADVEHGSKGSARRKVKIVDGKIEQRYRRMRLWSHCNLGPKQRASVR